MPPDLIEEIDALVGQRGRSAFLVETARAEVRRPKLLAFLTDDTAVMRDPDHPELAAMVTQAWVKKSRSGWKARRTAVAERSTVKK